MSHEEGKFLRHEPCPQCPSSDAFAVYDSGWGHCFSCGCNVKVDQEGPVHTEVQDTSGGQREAVFAEGEVQALPARGLTEETCRKFGYKVGTYAFFNKKTKEEKVERVHIAPYYRNGRLVAQKLRTKNKDFKVVGEGRDLPLFGQHLWSNGKILVICEGEIDAMTVAQVQGLKFASVSVPNGAQGAAKSLARNLDYLEGFERIVLMFDMDEPGRAAAQECAELLPPGRAYLAELPLKDPNECLLAGRSQDIISAIWQAKPYRPDGIVSVSDIKDELFKPVEVGRPWPWKTLTDLTYGRRYGELYAFGAGVGIGKTDVFTQTIAFDITELNEPVGVIYLEQPVSETVQRVAGKVKKKLFHVPDGGWTEEEYRQAVEELDAMGKLWLYRHFGSMDWEIIKGKIRYFNKALGIRHIYLDHLTALTATAEDERRALDKLMAEMASLAQELGIIVHFISHLTTPDGKPHEEGGRVMEKHFTGSRAIARWSHFMFGLERNKQAEDLVERSTTTFRILKDRYTGKSSGETFLLRYDRDTGHLYEADGFEDERIAAHAEPSEF